MIPTHNSHMINNVVQALLTSRQNPRNNLTARFLIVNITNTRICL